MRKLLLLGLTWAVTGCTLNDVYHTAAESLQHTRLIPSIGSDNDVRFRLHPKSSIALQPAEEGIEPAWIAHARAGVGHVFPSSKTPDYRLMIAWADKHPSPTLRGAKEGTLNINMLLNPPTIAAAETLNVQILDATDNVIHQQRLSIKLAVWQGNWDSAKAMESAFYQFALQLAGH